MDYTQISIIKRDGKTEPFSLDKIVRAITKAFRAGGITDEGQAVEQIASDVAAAITKAEISVEEIQDMVEERLMKRNPSIAKRYIIYREWRNVERDRRSSIKSVMDGIVTVEKNDINLSNANMSSHTPAGQMMTFASEITKDYALKYLVGVRHGRAHRDGDIHIHDLDYYPTKTTTCIQYDLGDIYERGFSTKNGSVRTPQSIQSYATLATIVFQTNQNEQHGGQSIPAFDHFMAPGVLKTFRRHLTDMTLFLCGVRGGVTLERAELKALVAEHVPTIEPCETAVGRLFAALRQSGVEVADEDIRRIWRQAYDTTRRETHQAMEGFIHNLNTMHSRGGNQVVFSSVNYGTDFSPEGRMVIRELLSATIEGLGHGEVPVFPIQIFKVKEGVNYNPGDPNYDLFKLAIRVSAKRMFPNFSFIDAPFNLQYYKPGDYHTEAAYMGCRTRVIGNIYDPSREIVTGRGNLSFTTINLPRLAIEAHGDIDKFYASLDEMMDLVVDQLLARFRIQCSKHVRNYPFLMGQGVWIDSEKLSENDSVAEILKHGTLSMGFIGLAECLKALIGVHHGESPEAQNLGLDIITRMRKRMDDESEKTRLNFSLLATPAEGLSGRFVRMDKKIYGEIPGVTDREYYTNSFHIPVYYNISAFRKIKLEAPYHALTNGGHISYIELDGDPLKNLDAFGYGAINHPIDRDPKCGYTGIIDDECPCCHRKEEEIAFERIRRITGYLVGTLDRFNNAKRAEESDRVKHGTSEE